MNDFLRRYGTWGLIAGSAEGLGESFSRTLATRKMNLVMVDHKDDVLKKLAEEIENKYGIKTRTLVLDLAGQDSADIIMNAVQDLDCRLMVYNAAYSQVKPFLKNTAEDLDNYVNVNTRSLIRLTLPFSIRCRDAGSGGILIMSSLAGLWGSRMIGPYGATKAFGCVLAESLHHELKAYGIDVMACIAGATATGAYLATEPKYSWPRPNVMMPDIMAEEAIRHLGKKVFYVPGLANRINYFILTRILSRKMAGTLFNRTTVKMYRDKI